MIDNVFYHVSRGDPEPGTMLEGRFLVADAPDIAMMQIAGIVADLETEQLNLIDVVDQLVSVRSQQAMRNQLSLLNGGTFPDGGEHLVKLATAPKLSMVLMETIYERVRVSHYPDRPSRLGAIFLFDEAEDATWLNQQMQAGSGTVFECRLESGAPFLADMNLVRNLRSLRNDVAGSPIDIYTDRAHHYWRGEHADDARIEVVVNPGQVVVEQEIS